MGNNDIEWLCGPVQIDMPGVIISFCEVSSSLSNC